MDSTRIRGMAVASGEIAQGALEHLNEAIKSADPTDRVNPVWADATFGILWSHLMAAAIASPQPDGMAAFCQVISAINGLLHRDPAWAEVHKGAHYFNVGLFFTSIREPEAAGRFFVLADQEDERVKGTPPGDIFRRKDLYTEMRARFFDSWIAETESNFSDGLQAGDRSNLLLRALCAMPRRNVPARCQLGLWQSCFLHLEEKFGLVSHLPTCLDAVGNLGVFCEGVARLLHVGTAPAESSATLGAMLKGGAPCGNAGFVIGGEFKPCDPARGTQSLQTLADARSGGTREMARIVTSVRNQAAHATDEADWYLDMAVQRDVLRVQLDFITCVSAAYESGGSRLPEPH